MSAENDDGELPGYEEPVEGGEAENSNYGQSSSRHAGVHAASFRDMLLREPIQRSITECGFEHPSEVQQDCIPQAVMGNDIICQAKSGMGKTAVFVICTLHQISLDATSGVDTLVLVNTRELALQISDEFCRLSKYLPDVKVATLMGGIPKKTHVDLLKNERPNVVVGTPGRVLELIQDKVLKVQTVKRFIMDECDLLLEVSIRPAVQAIFKACPLEKQVMMFTATLSEENKRIAHKFCSDPIEVYPTDESKLTLHGLVQYYVKLDEGKKTRKLYELLTKLEYNQTMVFVKSGKRAKTLQTILVENGQPCGVVTGNMDVKTRMDAYRQFRNGSTRILIATDVYSRGVDFEKVNIVINYDLPAAAESKSSTKSTIGLADQYLHRAGRSGRFGTKGLAISFAESAEDMKVLEEVQARFQADIPVLPDTVETSAYMDSGI